MSFIYREVPPHPDAPLDRKWSVGFYNPHGDWQSESTHPAPEKAAERVHWLNGGENRQERAYTNTVMERLAGAIRNMPHVIRTRPF